MMLVCGTTPEVLKYTYPGQIHGSTFQHFNILSTGGVYAYLVGGMNIDIAIMAVKPTKHIYNLVYNGTYHWTHDTPDISNMLKQCKQCCLVFQNQKIFDLKEVFLEFDIEGTVK